MGDQTRRVFLNKILCGSAQTKEKDERKSVAQHALSPLPLFYALSFTLLHKNPPPLYAVIDNNTIYIIQDLKGKTISAL